MKQWFPILENKIRFAIDKILTVVVSCFILLNITKHIHVGDEEFEVQEISEDNFIIEEEMR